MGDHPAGGAAASAAPRGALTDTLEPAPAASGQRQVRVAVDAVADRPERSFLYRLPERLGDPAPGSLVLVPYGGRLALGYVMPSFATGPDSDSAEPGEDLREIEAVVSGPILTPDLLALAEQLAAYYRAPLGIAISTMLPAGLESRLERRWEVVDPDLGLGERLIGDAELRAMAPDGAADRWITRLRRRGAIRAEWRLASPAARARRIRTIRSVGEVDGIPPARGPLQRGLLESLTPAPRPLAAVADELGVEPARLLAPARALERGGLAELGWHEEPRDPLGHRRALSAVRPPLAGEQGDAVEAIEALRPGGELLLEGVAASGKSDVYLAAAEAELAHGRGSILLVPEVSLVPQLADRARAVFGQEVAVLHSSLSPGERHDEWWRILRGEARIVVGTRMAVFAPLAALGLIVVDEEHEGAYKEDRTPRHDARWVARRRATLTGARAVMGSATPGIVTLHRARSGATAHTRLVERRVGRPPSVEVVDLRAELADGNRSIFSRRLQSALAQLRPGSEQAILLVNRRGASTFVLCRDCGFSLRCPECDLPFVYHLDGGMLRCHHCGRTGSVPRLCPACGGARIRYFGTGTQRVEAELRRVLPSLRSGRLDSDAIARRRGHERVYDAFRDGRLDVLIGTQMVAKGLDLPAVTLAAVVAADVTLNLPDFRAAERTFQLVAQVAGRAGRGPREGRVIVQSYAPDHYAIRTAARLDVAAFADEELPRRRLLGYPPYRLLARLILTDADRRRAEERASATADAMRSEDVEVLGPVPAYVARRGGRWRMQLVVRADDEDARRSALERVPAGVAIDVDPESLL